MNCQIMKTSNILPLLLPIFGLIVSRKEHVFVPINTWQQDSWDYIRLRGFRRIVFMGAIIGDRGLMCNLREVYRLTIVGIAYKNKLTYISIWSYKMYVHVSQSNRWLQVNFRSSPLHWTSKNPLFLPFQMLYQPGKEFRRWIRIHAVFPQSRSKKRFQVEKDTLLSSPMERMFLGLWRLIQNSLAR